MKEAKKMSDAKQNIQKDKIIHLIRQRIISSILDFYLFGLIASFFLYVMAFTPIDSNLVPLLTVLIAFIFYFGVIVKISDGYTLGGFLLKVKIIKMDHSDLGILFLSKRAFIGMLIYVSSCSFRCTKFNSLGQFKFDEKFGTTVVNGREKNVFFDQNKKEYYEYDYLLDWQTNKYIIYAFLILILFLLLGKTL